MQTKLDLLINARGEFQALDEGRKRIFALRAEVGALSSAIQAGAGLSIGASLVSGLAAIPAAFKNAIAAGVSYNATLEKQTASFKTLLGSATEATARMRELAKFAADTPFELPQLVQASRTLQTFTGNALAAGEGLRLVGDASSAVNAPIAETSMWMGRLFAAIRQGTSTGEAVQNLTQLGLITADTRGRLMALQGQALSEAAAMDVMRASFGRYAGAMQEQATTFEGLSSTLSDTLGMIRGEATKPLFETLKQSLKDVTAQLSSEGFASGLKVGVRMLADLAAAGIKVAEVLTRFSDVLMVAAAAWAAMKIGQQVDGMLSYAKSLGATQTAQTRLVAAVEAEIAALTAKQAALSNLIALQARLNALQSMGNTAGGAASAWAPGVKSAAASEALSATRSIEGMNTALKAAPGLMARVATGGRALFAGLGGWGTVAVAGMFAIEWWKSWRLESIDAMDQVRSAASTKLKELRTEIAAITTELQRTLTITRLEAQLAVAQANPKKFSKEDVEGIQKALEFTKRTSAADIAASHQSKAATDAAADPIGNIDTLLQKHEETLQRRNRLQQEFNGLTAEQVLAQRRASEQSIADLKARQAAIRSSLEPLQIQRAQLKAYTDQTAPALPDGKIEDTPAGFLTSAKKVLRKGDGFQALTDEEVSRYEAAQKFAEGQATAQAAVNASQAEYNRLQKESSDISSQIAQVESTMPKAEKLDDYVQAAKEANKLTEEEAKAIAELRSERRQLGATDAMRLVQLREEIALEEQKVTTMADGLAKEQALTSIKKKQVEVQTILDKQAKDEIDTAVRVAQIKQGAAQREREAIEKRRVDGKLSVADQQLLAGVLADEKKAIEELIAAYKRLKAAKGTSEADQAAAQDTINALNQQKDTLGAGSPPGQSRYQQSENKLADMGSAQNSFQNPTQAVSGGLMDVASEAGSAMNGIHDSVVNIGNAMQSGIGGTLQGLINRTMTWRQGLANIGSTILSSIVSSVATMFAKWIVGELALFALRSILRKKEDQDTSKSTGLKAVEGGMKSISQLGPIWGTIAFVGALAAIFAITSSLGSRATGGPVVSGRPYLVGEYGPELVIPSESAVVMNHKETAAVAERLAGSPRGGSGGTSYVDRATVLVDSRREADRFRRGSNMEVQIIDVMQRNRYRVFGT